MTLHDQLQATAIMCVAIASHGRGIMVRTVVINKMDDEIFPFGDEMVG